jgi:hypothetical protein
MCQVSPQSFVLIFVVAACGGSSPPPAKASPQPSANTAGDPIPLCKRIFAHKATCADDYLPALLDVRIELNMPPGIGERVKTEGRDAILAIAHTELARDTEPSKVAELCETTVRKMPPERVEQLVEHGGRCEAAADCMAFSTCVVDIDRGFIAAESHRRAAQPAQP